MKLEAKHLAPYLPYNLQVEYRGKVTTLDALDSTGGAFVGENRMVSFVNQKYIKPILRPLSSMTKEEAYDLLCLIVGIRYLDYTSLNYEYSILEIKGEFPFNDFVSGIKYTINISDDGIACFDTGSNGMYIPHSAYNYLFSKHFDVFGLIDEGLAIEKK